jgi:hypothetical protein
MARDRPEIRLLLVDALASEISKETAMNFTGGNTLPNIGRRINWQLVTLAGGLAVALSAGALAGAFERGGSQETATAPQRAALAVSRPIAPALSIPSEVVYIVTDSQAEANALTSAISSAAASMPELAELTGILNVVKLDTPATEEQFNNTLARSTTELMAENIGVRVVDLRQPSNSGPFLVSSDAGGQAQAIVYVVDSEAEAVGLRQQFNEAGNEASGNVVRDVLVIDASNEDLFNTVVGEQMTTGSFTVIDLR